MWETKTKTIEMIMMHYLQFVVRIPGVAMIIEPHVGRHKNEKYTIEKLGEMIQICAIFITLLNLIHNTFR